MYPGTPPGFPVHSPTPGMTGPPPYGAPNTPTDSGYYGSMSNVVPSPLSRGGVSLSLLLSLLSLSLSLSLSQQRRGEPLSLSCFLSPSLYPAFSSPSFPLSPSPLSFLPSPSLPSPPLSPSLSLPLPLLPSPPLPFPPLMLLYLPPTAIYSRR